MERMKAKSKDSKSVLQTLQEMEENVVGEEHKTELLENNDFLKRKEAENLHKEAVQGSKASEFIETDGKVPLNTEEETSKMEKSECLFKNETGKIKEKLPKKIIKDNQKVKENYSAEMEPTEKKDYIKKEDNITTVISMPAELIGEADGTNPVILDRDTALQNLQQRIFVKPNYSSSTSVNLVTEYYVFLSTRAAQLKLTTNMYFHILLNEDRFYREITGDHEPIFEQVMYKYKGSRAHKNISFVEEDRKYFIEESTRLGIKYTVFAHYLIEKEMDRENQKGKRKIGEIILREE